MLCRSPRVFCKIAVLKFETLFLVKLQVQTVVLIKFPKISQITYSIEHFINVLDIVGLRGVGFNGLGVNQTVFKVLF